MMKFTINFEQNMMSNLTNLTKRKTGKEKKAGRKAQVDPIKHSLYVYGALF